ncbi:hypothetical protein FA13DRAFT_1735660, partial [Coprinellus micaceus]
MSLQTPPPSRTGFDPKADFTTDVPPVSTMTAAHVLQDKERMKKLTATFCDAMFSYPDQATIDKVVEESLRLCGGSEDILSAVLQTKFFAGHTPFYWAIVNKDPKQAGVPPLLERLLSICSNTVDETAQADMMWGLLGLKDSDDSLYQQIKTYLGTSSPVSIASFFRDKAQQPTARAVGGGGFGCVVNFCIPLLFDRLVLDKEVCLTFIAMGSLWHLRAIAACSGDWTWHFHLTEVKSKYKYSTLPLEKRKRRLTVKLERSVGGQPSLQCTAEQEINKIPSTVKVAIPNSELKSFQHNPYTAKQTRELVGTLEIKDTRL